MLKPSRSIPVRSCSRSSAPLTPLPAPRPLNPRAPAFIPNSFRQTPIIVDSSTYNPPSPELTPDNAPGVNPRSILYPIPAHLQTSPQRELPPRLVTPPLLSSPLYRVPPNWKTHGTPGVQILEDTASLRRLIDSQPAGTPGYETTPGTGPPPPPYFQGTGQQGMYNQSGYNPANSYFNNQQQYVSPENTASQVFTNMGPGDRSVQAWIYAQSQQHHVQSQQPYAYAQHQPHFTQTRQYHSQTQHSYTYTQQEYPQDPELRCYCADCVRYRNDMEWYDARVYAYEIAHRMRMQVQFNIGIGYYYQRVCASSGHG